MIPGLEHYKKKWAVASEQVIKPGLDAIQMGLSLVGNPHEQLQVVHLAGTNGKGSTLTFIESIASQHGLKAGKFMSPCIVDVHDQIQVAGIPMTETQLDTIFQDMYLAGISGRLTDFELLTVAAFMQFKRENVDIVLLEAGMGGRYDSTNVVTPIVSVIPSIALEHTNFLGNTLSEISGHKAGIIKQGRPVVVGTMEEEAFQVIRQEARNQHAPLLLLEDRFEVVVDGITETYLNDKYGIVIKGLLRKMVGPHQADNMALAITAFFEVATELKVAVDLEAIRKGINQSSLASRFEEVLPNIYFDGAHNPASATTLVATIQQQFPNQEIHFIVGMLGDKNVEGVLRILEQVSNYFSFVDFENSRAMTAEKMLTLSKAEHKYILRDVKQVLQNNPEKEYVIIVTGSLYLLTSLRNLLVQ